MPLARSSGSSENAGRLGAFRLDRGAHLARAWRQKGCVRGPSEARCREGFRREGFRCESAAEGRQRRGQEREKRYTHKEGKGGLLCGLDPISGRKTELGLCSASLRPDGVAFCRYVLGCILAAGGGESFSGCAGQATFSRMLQGV